jgi:hypothetical protein
MGHNENLVILTDFDPAVDAAIEDVLPGAVHLSCIWHQSECIWKNCKSKLGNGFERFKRNFFDVGDSFSEEEFEEKWKSLLASYPVVSNYLSGTWYSVRSKWATAWTQKRFTAGMKTTSGAESINSVVRRVMKCNTNSTLVQVYQAFHKYLDTKMVTEQYAGPSPLINPEPTFRVAFSAFEEALTLIHQFSSSANFNEGVRLCNDAFAFRVENVSALEAEQDLGTKRYAALLPWISASLELFVVRSVLLACKDAEELVVVLPDHSALCTCLKQVMMGVPCVHFWAAMLKSSSLKFTIASLNPRWITNPRLSFPRFFTCATKWSNQNRVLIPAGYGMLIGPLVSSSQPQRVRERTGVHSIGRAYANCMALTRRAFASVAGDPLRAKQMYDSLLQLQAEMDAGQHTAISGNMDEQLQNPVPAIPKGRPRGSRIPSSSEPRSKKGLPQGKLLGIGTGMAQGTKNGRFCRNCNEVGHHVRTCPASCKCSSNVDGHRPKDCSS